jgi:hypothetical protein
MANHLERLRADVLPPDAWAEPDDKLLPKLAAQALAAVQGEPRAAADTVRQVVRRLEWPPEDGPILLPVLGAVLRRAQGPVWREALSAAVRWGQRYPEKADLLRRAVPELSLG